MKIPRTDRRLRSAVNTIELLEKRQLLTAEVLSTIPTQSLTVSQSAQTLSLTNYFKDPTITAGDTVVNMELNLEPPNATIPIELTNAATPNTVANFLRYVDDGQYTNSIIHRLVPGFVIQGGGYYPNADGFETFGEIQSEASTATLHNTTGTIAMALSAGPNTATSQFYFNLADNSQLDGTSDGGPFTAFGQVIYNGLSVLDNIATLPTVDDTANGAWTNLPVLGYNGTSGATYSSVPQSALIEINPVVEPGGLIFTANSSNSSVVAASLNTSTGNLTLTPAGAGNATISVTATDMGGTTVSSTFTVDVVALPKVSIGNASATIGTSSHVVFPVTLSSASTSNITLNYTLTSGTAPSSDYQATGSSLTIPAGSTTADISVNALANPTTSGVNFTITLSGLSSNAAFNNGNSTETATGTILPAGVTAVATTTTLTATSPTVASGASDTFTASVTPARAGAAVTGTVDFSIDGTTVGTSMVTNGSATLSPTLSTAGDQTVTATYSGGGNYTASTSNTVTVDVTSGSTTTLTASTTTLTASATSVAIGANLSFTAVVTGATPTGTVTFSIGGTSLGSAAVTAGAATLSTDLTAIGDQVVTATYSGDAGNSPSTSTGVTVSVIPATPTTTVTASVPAVVAGGSVTLTATVSGYSPTGTIDFSVAGASIGTETLTGGTASITTSLTAPGDQSVTATYSGDANNSGGTSPAITVNVTTLTPTVSKTTVPTSVVAGGAITGTVQVAAKNDTSAIEKGAATFVLYATTDGIVDSSSIAIATVKKSVDLTPGKSVAVSIPVKSLPASLSAGNYTLITQTTSPAGQISNAASGPTLSVGAAEISFNESIVKLPLPTAVVAGAKTPVSITLKISNGGNVPSKGTTTIQLYASTDGTAASGTLFKTAGKSLSIKPGKFALVSVPLSAFPDVTNGNYFIVAQVTDPKGGISSVASALTVNIATATIVLTGSIAVVPASAVLGKSVAVTLDVSNSGNILASGKLDISFAASTAADGSNPVPLATTTTSISLKPGTSKPLHLKIPLAAGLSTGAVYLVAVVNPLSTFDGMSVASSTSISSTTITLT